MTAPITIEALDIDPEVVAEYREDVAYEYRADRSDFPPHRAAFNLAEAAAHILASGLIRNGKPNPFSMLRYLITCEYVEAAKRLDERRLRRTAA